MVRNNRIIFIVLVIIILVSIRKNIFVMAQVDNNQVKLDKIDEYIRSEMKELNIPGCSVGIVNNDKIVFQKSYGKADKDDRNINENTPFIIGSVSKSFTALAIMQLAENGKLNLDSEVQKYIPWFRLSNAEASKKITIRHLLNHTSGLPTNAARELLYIKNDLSLEELVRKLNSTAISKPVGSTYQYSNLNYIILGEVIQLVSGMSYEKYIEQNIFAPLDMKHSFTSEQKAKENGLASGFQPLFGYMQPTKTPYNQSTVSAGFLISSSTDMCNYLIAQINNGKYKDKVILSNEGVQAMHQPSKLSHYGLGWAVYPDKIINTGDTENFHSDIRIIDNGE